MFCSTVPTNGVNVHDQAFAGTATKRSNGLKFLKYNCNWHFTDQISSPELRCPLQ